MHIVVHKNTFTQTYWDSALYKKNKKKLKKTITFFTSTLILVFTMSFAQTALKEYKVGHIFSVSLPDYMSKTTGLNTSASIQFKNTIKDVYGFVIEDIKEELQLVEINYSSLNEFYEDFIKDFAKDEEKRNVSEPQSKKSGGTNFMECDVSYYDKESKIEIYYFVGLAETPSAYYKILCWSTLENKDKFKTDFQKTLYSLKD